MSLNPKQQRFAEEYLVDFNASAAYKRAGYKADGNAAEVNASKLLRNAQVQKLVQAGREVASKKTLCTVEYVIEGLKEVATRCMQREMVMVGRGKDRKPLVIEVTNPETGEVIDAHAWTFDSTGANRSLELLGKHVGAFTTEDETADLPMPSVVNINVINARKSA